MTKQNAFTREDLLRCSRGELFGPGNAQLPAPNMLMIDRITHISDTGGKYGKGEIVAELDITPDLWFFACHFEGDPVMPGCLGVDALWQLLGFYLGWRGNPGRGRALGSGEIKVNSVYNTGTGSGFGTNSLDPNAPQVIKIDGSGNYEVYDKNNNLLGVAPASSKGQNLMSALEMPLGTPIVPALTPGYDFSITGKVEANDSFTLSYNKDGFADNANGLALAELQNKDLVRKNNNAATSNDKMTFNEAYSALVTGVGNKASQAKTLRAALPPDTPDKVKVIFAENEWQAEELLCQVREPGHPGEE